MTQDERWNIRYQEVIEFIKINHRNPSKHRIEEHNMLNWVKQQRKLHNAGKLNLNAWQGTGTWHEPRSSVLPSLVLTGKRLGEEQLFSGAFGVFFSICAIFRAFCLVVLRFFVYLQT